MGNLATPAETLDRDIYSEYFTWKRWDRPFAYSPLDRDGYDRDFVDIDLAGKRLLEIGFGKGALLAWARDRGAVVSGCELTEESVAFATEAGVPLVPADFENAGGLAPESLDLVVAYDVFEHLDEPVIRAKAAAIAQALKPGGLLVLRYPNGQSPFGLIAQHGDATHKVALSCMKMEQLIFGTGLTTRTYRGAAFAVHDRLSHRVVTKVRHVLRRAIIKLIHLAFATDVPLEPVMLHVLVKSPPKR